LSRDAHAWVQVGFGVASIVVGVLLVVAPSTSLFAAYNQTIADAFFAGRPLTPQVQQMNHWLLATCGAGVVGWGLAWAWIAQVPLRRGEPWAWWCLSASLGVWVGIDVVTAVAFGVLGELVFVSVMAVGAGGHLLLCRRAVTTTS